MADTPSKVTSLLKRLAYATERNELEWSRTDRSEAYSARFPAGQTIIVASRDDDGQAPWELEVYTWNANKIETFSSEEYRDSLNLFDKLHSEVKRKVSGVDKVLDELLESLPTSPDEFF